jgi:hypothetical protein
MAAGLIDRLWTMEDIANMIDAALLVPTKRGPYKKRLRENQAPQISN